jgi:hypothetical protein
LIQTLYTDKVGQQLDLEARVPAAADRVRAGARGMAVTRVKITDVGSQTLAGTCDG